MKKLFISCDMEGSSGITHWDETDYDRGGRWYDYFREQMTKEVSAACRGALDAGVSEVTVKDAHDSARNIIPSMLPESVRIKRGWSGSILSMIQGIEEGFDALAFTGYHSAAGSADNPLAHTMNTSIDEIKINGITASEFLIHSYLAGAMKIPVIFISGDENICSEAAFHIPGIKTAAVSRGSGYAADSMHPADAAGLIYSEMRSAVSSEKNGFEGCFIRMPEHFDVTVRYTSHTKAFSRSHYPGTSLSDERTVSFCTDDYTEVMRFFHFVL